MRVGVRGRGNKALHPPSLVTSPPLTPLAHPRVRGAALWLLYQIAKPKKAVTPGVSFEKLLPSRRKKKIKTPKHYHTICCQVRTTIKLAEACDTFSQLNLPIHVTNTGESLEYNRLRRGLGLQLKMPISCTNPKSSKIAALMVNINFTDTPYKQVMKRHPGDPGHLVRALLRDLLLNMPAPLRG